MQNFFLTLDSNNLSLIVSVLILFCFPFLPFLSLRRMRHIDTFIVRNSHKSLNPFKLFYKVLKYVSVFIQPHARACAAFVHAHICMWLLGQKEMSFVENLGMCRNNFSLLWYVVCPYYTFSQMLHCFHLLF